MTFNKFISGLRFYFRANATLWIAKQRMRFGIKGARAVHRLSNENSAGREKNIRNYLILLELPVKDKNKRIIKKERLFWINRRNFQSIKRRGMLPKHMQLTELRHKAFYMSDMSRTYSEEFKAREQATSKYLNHVKSSL